MTKHEKLLARLMARLEKHDVGTGASCTSTFAECCKGVALG